MVALMKPDNHIAQPQKSNEWYTPTKYIEAARQVMGGIDLDPASCELANQTVKAKRYYGKEDDGLSKEWYGCVWLNPPYRRTPDNQGSNIGLFVNKLIAEYSEGRVKQAIALLTSKCDTKWFQLLWDHPICFSNHCVHFRIPNPTPKYPTMAHTYGSIFVYLGPYEHKFIEIFSEFGTIAKRVSPPKPASTTLWEVR